MMTQQYATTSGTTVLCLPDSEVTRMLDHHGVTSVTKDRVAALCIVCGTISLATSRDQRDIIQREFDLTCHSPHTTITPRF